MDTLAFYLANIPQHLRSAGVKGCLCLSKILITVIVEDGLERGHESLMEYYKPEDGSEGQGIQQGITSETLVWEGTPKDMMGSLLLAIRSVVLSMAIVHNEMRVEHVVDLLRHLETLQSLEVHCVSDDRVRLPDPLPPPHRRKRHGLVDLVITSGFPVDDIFQKFYFDSLKTLKLNLCDIGCETNLDMVLDSFISHVRPQDQFFELRVPTLPCNQRRYLEWRLQQAGVQYSIHVKR